MANSTTLTAIDSHSAAAIPVRHDAACSTATQAAGPTQAIVSSSQ
jgi:hypothetical protein